MQINRQIFYTLIILLLLIILFELFPIDLFIQDYFYTFDSRTWIINKNDPIKELIFYSGFKKVLIVFGISIIVALVFFHKKPLIKKYKSGLILVLLSLIMTPAVVGLLKKETNMPCPKNIERYGGDRPEIGLFESYPKDYAQMPNIRCWPAGHASGGFALLSLFFFFKSNSNKIIALSLAMVVGWTIGMYKVMIGDHFFSHNIITMMIAWLIILINIKIIKIFEKRYEKPTKI